MSDPLNTLGFLSWGLLGSAEGGTGDGPTQILESIETQVSVLENDLVLTLFTDEINISLSIDPSDIEITCEAVEITTSINIDETTVEIDT